MIREEKYEGAFEGIGQGDGMGKGVLKSTETQIFISSCKERTMENVETTIWECSGRPGRHVSRAVISFFMINNGGVPSVPLTLLYPRNIWEGLIYTGIKMSLP
ncbi:hypothetical protein HZH66_013262 [Vespula vulgaris]|uniref:Uncharacterized protein n=1 Tax=Vespula vulgaris TaxID=7454 RepID=A0A834MRV0_VESVU|nr:hypothetical protein HZH66_013262 [Vespula vulgaris]